MIFMTVPTAGNRREALAKLVADSGLPPSQVVIVQTKPNVDVPDGVVVVQDFDDVNIQRWWLRGIEEAERRGATYVAVLNDDVTLDQDSIPQLVRALQDSNAAIASPSRAEFRNGLHRKRLIPYAPRLWGCFWVLKLSSGLRPDLNYRWWYGDNDLDIRARRDHEGVVLAPVTFTHTSPGEGTGQSTELQALAEQDTVTFETQYFRMLWLSRLLQRWHVRFKSGRGDRP